MPVRTLVIFCALLFLGACAKEPDGPAAPRITGPSGELEVVFVAGATEAETRPGAGARAVRVGMRFGEKAILRTLDADARLDLRLPSGSSVRLAGKTVLVLAELYYEGSLNVEKTGLDLVAGSVLVKARALVGDARFRVRTETATVGVRGTEFIVNHDGSVGTAVAVQRGRVVVTPAVAVPAAVSDKGEAAVEQVRAAAAVEVGGGQEVTISPRVVEAQSKQVAEAVAGSAADADRVKVAADALRGPVGAPQPAAPERFRGFEGMPAVPGQPEPAVVPEPGAAKPAVTTPPARGSDAGKGASTTGKGTAANEGPKSPKTGPAADNPAGEF